MTINNKYERYALSDKATKEQLATIDAILNGEMPTGNTVVQDSLLDTQQAMQKLNISRSMLHKLYVAGRIKKGKIDGKSVYSANNLQAYIDSLFKEPEEHQKVA